MDLSNYEPHELTPETLDELCQEAFGQDFDKLKKKIYWLDYLRTELERLKIQRFAGMLRHTNKEDPLDCAYVRRCLIGLLMESDRYDSLKREIGFLAEE